jgi:MFS family permease
MSATPTPAAPSIFARRAVHPAELLVVATAVVLFLTLALHQHRLPGLYYDEAGDVVPAMQLLQGEPVSLQRGVGIHLFGRDFPVMIGDYWGTTSTYAVLPLFWLLGVDVLAIRLFPILAGALSVIATWQLGRRLFGQEVGAAAALLLAVSPTFIFWSRVGIYVIAHIVAITLGVWLAYLSWRKRPARWKLLVGAFLAGLGLTTKLLFAWFFIAIPAAYVGLLAYDWLTSRVGWRGLRAFVFTHLRERLPLRSPGDAVALAVGFGIGAFPVLYYNAVSRGSYHLLRANLGETERGVDNRAFLENVVNQARELRIFLDGGFFWFQGGVYTNPLATTVVALSGVGLLLLTLLPEHRHLRRTWVFLFGWALTIFILSNFSISILAATHLFILLPLPQLLIAAFVLLGCRSLAARVRTFAPRLALAVMLAGVVLLAGFAALDLRTDFRYHEALRRTGGMTAFSDAIYPLADWLDSNGHYRPYALDWGVRPNVMILTEGRVTPLEIYGQTMEPGAEFERSIIASLDEQHPVYITQTEVSAAFPRIDRFRELVEQHGGQVRLEQVFTQRDGIPAYYVFTVDLVRAERLTTVE